MTKFIVQLYSKGAKKPFKEGVFEMTKLGTFEDSFRGQYPQFHSFVQYAPRYKIRYESNGNLVGTSWKDVNGNRRIRWKF